MRCELRSVFSVSMPEKVLVTGAAGMLCAALVPVLRKAGYDVYPTDIVTEEKGIGFLDVRETKEVITEIARLRPRYVIHAAAKTDVELCEKEVDDAYLTNAVGTQNVALGCQKTGSQMVYISTAGVFDGKKAAPYTEFDEPNPLNVYGETKLAGERFVQGTLQKYFILRTTWMFGGGLVKDKKFVGKILRQLQDGRRRIHAVTDKSGTPTYTVDLSTRLCEMLKTAYYGLYHVVCEGKATRFDVAQQILLSLGRNDVKLIQVKSGYFSKEYFAPRAESEMLSNYLLTLRLMNPMRHWRVALEEYLHTNLPQD